MAQSTFSDRNDDQLKDQFEILEGSSEITSSGALAAFNSIRAKAIIDGLSDMNLKEINAEIDAALKENS